MSLSIDLSNLPSTRAEMEAQLGTFPNASADGFDSSYKTDANVDLTTFQSLLNKLEGSKKRQQRQKSVEGRRDVYAQGLATMMRNF